MTFQKVLRHWAAIAVLFSLLSAPLQAQSPDVPVGQASFLFVLSDSSMPVAGAALHLAIMALKSGRSVDVLLLANGLDLGRKGANGPEFAPYGASGPMMLGQAMAAGAQVGVCQICLKNQNIQADALIPGITPYNAYQVLDLMQTVDVIVPFGGVSGESQISIPMMVTPMAPEAAPAAPPSDDDACDPATDVDECM